MIKKEWERSELFLYTGNDGPGDAIGGDRTGSGNGDSRLIRWNQRPPINADFGGMERMRIVDESGHFDWAEGDWHVDPSAGPWDKM